MTSTDESDEGYENVNVDQEVTRVADELFEEKRPGLYIPKNSVFEPEYDPEIFRSAFPDVVKVSVEEESDAETGETITHVIRAMHASGDEFEFEVPAPPPDTAALIESIKRYHRSLIDEGRLDETAAALDAAIGDDD